MTSDKFSLKANILHTVRHLSDAEAGQLFKHLLCFANDEDSGVVNKTILIAFEPIKQELIKDLHKRKEISKVRSEAGKRSGAVRSKKKPTQKKKPEVEEPTPEEFETVQVIVGELVVNVKKSAFKQEVFDTFNKCKVHFESKYLPDSPTKVLKWVKEIDKLNRIDGNSFEDIVNVVRWGRNHSFWGNQFFTIMKLRKANDEGIKFFDRFMKQMSEKKKGKTDKREPSESKAEEDVSDWFTKKLG